MTEKSLLPSNRTTFEKEIEKSVSEPAKVPVPLRTIKDPLRTPDDFVPFVAWGLSTDIWDRKWDLEKKRSVANKSLRLHRIKGTLTGIKEYLSIVGTGFDSARVPPDTCFPDPAQTKAEREAYLERFQQVRVYLFTTRGKPTFGAFLRSGFKLSGLFPGGNAFPAQTDSLARIGRRATLFEPQTGEEVNLKRVERSRVVDTGEAVSFEQFAVRSKAGYAFLFGGRQRAKVFPTNLGASGRIFNAEINRSYDASRDELHLTSVRPTATPINVRPRRVNLPGTVRTGQVFPPLGGKAVAFAMRPSDPVARKSFLPPSTAAHRIYDQLYLHDPARLPDKRGARTFAGVTHLGMPAYTSILKVQIQGTAPRRASGRYVSGFLYQSDKSRIWKSTEAVRASKSLRDKILLTAKTMRPVTVGDGVTVGDVVIGQWVKAT